MKSDYIKVECSGHCGAYLAFPRGDADKMPKDFTCPRCEDDAMADFHIQRLDDERKRQEVYQGRGD